VRRLADKVCLVTGSSRGIGASIARAFAAEGGRVAVTYMTNEDAAVTLAEDLGDALCLKLDVRRWGDIRRAVDDVLSTWGRLDVLVNNAGYLEQKDFFEITEDEFDLTLDVNLKGLFFCTQEAGRVFRDQRAGCIVNVSSVGGQFGGPKAPHYAAAKAAVLSFTRSSARLLAPYAVRVNAIAPGFIRTDMVAELLERDEVEILAGIPLHRIGEPEAVASAAVYLASEESSFLTGQVLNVNGGQWMV